MRPRYTLLPVLLLVSPTVRCGSEANTSFYLLGSRRHSGDHVRPGLPREALGRLALLLEFCAYSKTNIFQNSTAEDNMNVQLKDITVTARDGRVSHLDQVYIRGSHVRFFIVPDMLR